MGRKREVVLRVLRGESLDALSRELGVEIYRLDEVLVDEELCVRRRLFARNRNMEELCDVVRSENLVEVVRVELRSEQRAERPVNTPMRPSAPETDTAGLGAPPLAPSPAGFTHYPTSLLCREPDTSRAG